MPQPKYTARMQELWISVGLRGFCIGAAFWPLLLIHSVVGSVRMSVGQPHMSARDFAGGLRASVWLFKEAALPTMDIGLCRCDF